jgi:hypothetical protein
MDSIFNNYWSDYREELIATSLVLVVAVGGSFFILHRLVSPTPPQTPALSQPQASQEIADVINQNRQAQVLGNQTTGETPVVTGTPSLAPTVPAQPTGDPYLTEVFYGTGGLYQYDGYKLGLNSPRMVIDARDTSSRKLVIDMVLTNNSVASGLQNNLTGTIIKDGIVIVPQAAMSVTESKVVMPGETFNFQAKLSLIEGTDVSIISFRPPGAQPVEHILRP